MSMTKRYIGELQERSQQGDQEAARILREAGLDTPTDEECEEMEAASHSAPHSSF